MATSRFLLCFALMSGACEGEGSGDSGLPACTELDLQNCSLAFQPTFDNVHAQVLGPTCSPSGGACHGQADAIGANNGLLMSDPDAAHEALVDLGFVIPGDAACSEVMVRLETDDTSFRMPPGNTALDANARCAIAHWIQDGAER